MSADFDAVERVPGNAGVQFKREVLIEVQAGREIDADARIETVIEVQARIDRAVHESLEIFDMRDARANAEISRVIIIIVVLSNHRERKCQANGEEELGFHCFK